MEVIYAVNCLDKPDSPGPRRATRPRQESEERPPGARSSVELTALRLLAGTADRAAERDLRRGRRPDRRHRHHPRPGHALRVVGPAARAAGQRLAHHLRRRRPHGLHADQRVRRRRRRHLLPRGHRAEGTGCAAPTRRRTWPGFARSRSVRILVRRARARSGACRLSSVGQSDSLVMNRSRVRFPLGGSAGRGPHRRGGGLVASGAVHPFRAVCRGEGSEQAAASGRLPARRSGRSVA